MLKPYWIIKWKDYWSVTEDIEINNTIIPKSFVTDLWSYPRFFWIIEHPLSIKNLKSNLLHDFRYSNLDNTLTRKEADLEYLRSVKGFRIVKYLAVRVFGGLHYKKPLPFKKEFYKK